MGISPRCRGPQRHWLVRSLFPDNLAAYKSIKTRLLGMGASSSSRTAVRTRDCASGTIKLLISFQNRWAGSGGGAGDWPWQASHRVSCFISLSVGSGNSSVTHGPVKETAAPSLTVFKLCAL